MTPEGRDGLAAAIEVAVRATPGVRTVYRSGSLISNLLRAGAEAIGVRAEEEPIVSVAFVGDAVAVEASLGVDAGARSADVMHAVHAAVDGVLGARGLRRESITLTVAHVQSRGVS
ncbi:hypothetical protein [Microbacterium sp. MYb62]|uniref:hypothetical protein n=1 Tax=Microbacterium sp. MYb62 TaxID=1848690 RepID=UPI000CFC2BB0|nr:hypothetical protein [Microbacterium sp. MYb62]PRB16086.1 hypothetical protein CQ042_08195 [Microbacterium sp. MYb62]